MREFVKILMVLQSAWMFISSIAYIFIESGTDKWFTRLAFAYGCIAVAGIIDAIEENKKP